MSKKNWSDSFGHTTLESYVAELIDMAAQGKADSPAAIAREIRELAREEDEDLARLSGMVAAVLSEDEHGYVWTGAAAELADRLERVLEDETTGGDQ